MRAAGAHHCGEDAAIGHTRHLPAVRGHLRLEHADVAERRGEDHPVGQPGPRDLPAQVNEVAIRPLAQGAVGGAGGYEYGDEESEEDQQDGQEHAQRVVPGRVLHLAREAGRALLLRQQQQHRDSS